MSNGRAPSRQGNWQTNVPQQPTIAVTQSIAAQSLGQAGAGTGAAPHFGSVAFGTGVPTFSAPNGQLYIRFDGTHGAVTLVYLNTSGANTVGTTWTAVL